FGKFPDEIAKKLEYERQCRMSFERRTAYGDGPIRQKQIELRTSKEPTRKETEDQELLDEIIAVFQTFSGKRQPMANSKHINI
ncbi:hypothetical protein SNEBB_002976, partial [Seison nebaliae]